jgi:hypothetical protein
MLLDDSYHGDLRMLVQAMGSLRQVFSSLPPSLPCPSCTRLSHAPALAVRLSMPSFPLPPSPPPSLPPALQAVFASATGASPGVEALASNVMQGPYQIISSSSSPSSPSSTPLLDPQEEDAGDQVRRERVLTDKQLETDATRQCPRTKGAFEDKNGALLVFRTVPGLVLGSD